VRAAALRALARPLTQPYDGRVGARRSIAVQLPNLQQSSLASSYRIKTIGLSILHSESHGLNVTCNFKKNLTKSEIISIYWIEKRIVLWKWFNLACFFARNSGIWGNISHLMI
jgi:hypothetical protein